MKFPDNEAKSSTLLYYSLCIFALIIHLPDLKCLFCIIGTASFVLSAISFIDKDFHFPLVPCKNRCIQNSKIVCTRDKGFCLGVFVSILTIIFFRKYQPNIPFFIKNNSLYIGIVCTLTTIIHGTLRRNTGVLISDTYFNNFLTFVVGYITGNAILFIGIYLIYN
jgi:hypothetical protein